MSKTKKQRTADKKKSSGDVQTKLEAAAAKSATKAQESSRNLRETVESVAIAFILAFLFRTFEAEAFVIPTGSMAPTLQGQHKDVDCPKCGYRYQASASEEEGDDVQAARRRLKGAETKSQRDAAEFALAAHDIVTATCPMCRYTMTVDPHDFALYPWTDEERAEGAELPSYSGDRILVGKFVYAFKEPERWDVIVFKFPGDANMNYIKRLVGLPGEELRIYGGDIHTRPLGSEQDFQIARKPPQKVLAMAQVVHDNAYMPAELFRAGWPRRWQAWTSGENPGEGWQSIEPDADEVSTRNVPQSFTIQAGGGEHWIRYQHFTPSFEDWMAVASEISQPPITPNPRLITDFYAYNASQTRHELGGVPLRDIQPTADKLGVHWVGDLMVECDVEVEGSGGELLLDLVEGGNHFYCRIDVGSGAAQLSSPAVPGLDASARTSLAGPGSYSVRFANFDNQLLLWVDDDLVLEAPYDLMTRKPVSTPDDPGDLAPIGIGSAGAALRITNLRVLRDIYYVATMPSRNASKRSPAYINEYLAQPTASDQLYSDPERWDVFGDRSSDTFKLERFDDTPQFDQFLVLGDNSPFSKDSRLWKPEGLEPYVQRQLLIGKALCIYWPHSWDRIPGTPIPFPFFPNFQDMGLVR